MKTPDWVQVAEAWAVQQLAQGDIPRARQAMIDRAQFRDEMLTATELIAAVSRND